MTHMRRRTRTLLSIATVVAAALLAFGWIRLSSPPDPRERLRALREELAVLRASADSCRDALAAEERALRNHREDLDSLRERVRSYESLDPRGVPADRYDAYLESFERYNREAGGWPTASETLQAHWRACRSIAVAHNAIADSARALARELGLWIDSVPPDGG
jgi:hypothetical protein